jgi:hypothetical protein
MASSERTDTAAAPAATEAAPALPARGTQNAASADQAAPVNDIRALRFEATVNGRYHTSRQGWYEFCHRWCMFVVVMFGAGAVAEAAGSGFHYSWAFAVISTGAGTLDLVFDFSAKAAQHARLQEKSYEIIAEIEQSIEDPAVVCRRGWAAMARIWAQEPKTMRVVQALAYNDTKEGTEKDVQDELIPVPLRSRVLKHVFPYDGRRFDPSKKVVLREAA